MHHDSDVNYLENGNGERNCTRVRTTSWITSHFYRSTLLQEITVSNSGSSIPILEICMIFFSFFLSFFL